MEDGEDYFDRIVGEIEDLIIDERFLELQSGTLINNLGKFFSKCGEGIRCKAI